MNNQQNQAEKDEIIFDSAPSKPDDDFWLDQGKAIAENSFAAIQEAAKALMSGLGILNGIYLGILGFAELVPKSTHIFLKCLYTLPLVFWLFGLFLGLQVMMPKSLHIFLHSPDNIKKNIENSLNQKQQKLKCAFAMLALGLALATLLILLRFSTS